MVLLVEKPNFSFVFQLNKGEKIIEKSDKFFG